MIVVTRAGASPQHQPMDAQHIRAVVKDILGQRGFTNRFTVRLVSFQDLARDKAFVVTIKGWQPNPVAEEIEAEIRAACKVLVVFAGAGFVQS